MNDWIIVVLTAAGTKFVDWLFTRKQTRTKIMDAEITNLRAIIEEWRSYATQWRRAADESQSAAMKWQQLAADYKYQLDEAIREIKGLRNDIARLRGEKQENG